LCPPWFEEDRTSFSTCQNPFTEADVIYSEVDFGPPQTKAGTNVITQLTAYI